MPDPTVVRRRLCVLAAACLWFPAAPGARAQVSADRRPGKWSNPTTLPMGALSAVARGDPRGPGDSTILLSMPDGYRIGPHFHPTDEHVQVMEGTLLMGMGDSLVPERTRALAAGSSATTPAGKHHYWVASGRTVVAVTFMGPYTITYLRVEDAPRPRNFPFGY